MWPPQPETRDRAVDGRLGHVVGPDAEPRGHAGAEALEDDVRPRDERPAQVRFYLQIADD